MLLFINAAKSENSGNYQEAVITYEKALFEARKSKFHRHLRTKIVEKLKLMQTIKTYKDNLSFIRKDNSWINS